jgi:hypothetical protein
MKKYILTAILAIILVVAGLLSIHKTNANPSTIQRAYLGTSAGISSTTATYLNTLTSTSTLVSTLDGQDQFDLNLSANASSTASNINFAVDYSDDYSCFVQTNCNWYREDANSTTGNTTTHQSLVNHLWVVGSVATTTKNISFTSKGARFVRVSFSSPTGSTTLWAEVATKGQRN